MVKNQTKHSLGVQEQNKPGLPGFWTHPRVHPGSSKSRSLGPNTSQSKYWPRALQLGGTARADTICSQLAAPGSSAAISPGIPPTGPGREGRAEAACAHQPRSQECIPCSHPCLTQRIQLQHGPDGSNLRAECREHSWELILGRAHPEGLDTAPLHHGCSSHAPQLHSGAQGEFLQIPWQGRGNGNNPDFPPCPTLPWGKMSGNERALVGTSCCGARVAKGEAGMLGVHGEGCTGILPAAGSGKGTRECCSRSQIPGVWLGCAWVNSGAWRIRRDFGSRAGQSQLGSSCIVPGAEVGQMWREKKCVFWAAPSAKSLINLGRC